MKTLKIKIRRYVMIEEEMKTADNSMIQAIKGLNAEVGKREGQGRNGENPNETFDRWRQGGRG